jgi:hypothetical protein
LFGGTLKRFIFSLAVFVAASSVSWGTSIWHEGDDGQGDAGALPGNANITIGSGPLTDIVGTLGDPTGGADMYEIFIVNPATFSATTTGPGTNGVVNPSIYLFDSTGKGLFGNDNISGTNFQASLPVGTTNALASGLYFILITPSGHLPENGSTLLFGDLTNTTTVTAASSALIIKKYATGAAPSPGASGKDYDIVLTGAGFAEAPEPAAVALMGLGLAALAWRSRRVRG